MRRDELVVGQEYAVRSRAGGQARRVRLEGFEKRKFGSRSRTDALVRELHARTGEPHPGTTFVKTADVSSPWAEEAELTRQREERRRVTLRQSRIADRVIAFLVAEGIPAHRPSLGGPGSVEVYGHGIEAFARLLGVEVDDLVPART